VVLYKEMFQSDQISFIVKNYRVGLNSITFYYENDKSLIFNEMKKFRIIYSYSSVGPMEEAANEYLETLIASNKYNI
jgi:hypothetical protein